MSELPSSLTPQSEHQPLPLTGKECFQCGEPRPIANFSRHGGYYNRRCNRCRGFNQYGTPYAQRKKALEDEARSKPCVKCGHSFPPVATKLLHVRGEKTFEIMNAWRWVSEESLAAELAKCEPICANCVRMYPTKHNGKVGRPRRVVRLDLADVPPALPRNEIAQPVVQSS